MTRTAPTVLSAPFPWFGGKSRAADLVWSRFGDVGNYVEPFAGSLAILLARPHTPRAETVNDKDCYLSNFWRALRVDPDAVAEHADWPVNEADLHARHVWLVRQAEFRERMLSDPDYYDARIAGWWVWGVCQWIGGNFCAVRERPWRQHPNIYHDIGVHCKRVQLGRGARGVSSKRPMLKLGLPGVHRQLPNLGGARSGSGRGVLRWGVPVNGGLHDWFELLATRLRRTRVCCGDWTRVLGRTPTTHIGLTGVVLDPPYSAKAGRYSRRCGLYPTDDLQVAEAVRQWALDHGHDPKMRIALCGYEGEHAMPADWECVPWLAQGGYGNQTSNKNRERERIWFSPHCLRKETP